MQTEENVQYLILHCSTFSFLHSEGNEMKLNWIKLQYTCCLLVLTFHPQRTPLYNTKRSSYTEKNNRNNATNISTKMKWIESR